jgi:hypothetical protein
MPSNYWTPAKARRAFLPLHLCQPSELADRLDFWDVEEQRFLACTYYSNCLHYTGALRWESFSCKGCQLYVAPNDRRS